MNRCSQRKLQPTVRIVQHQKQINSDLQSLLVSSVRYDTLLNSQLDSHADLPHSPSPTPSGSLIKKNKGSNVYIEESSCDCQEKIETLASSIKLFTLKVQELEAKLNICFGKQASLQSQLADASNRQELAAQKEWEAQLSIKELAETVARLQQQSKLQSMETNEDLAHLKKALARFESREGEKCRESRLLSHQLQKCQELHNARINELIQTMEEMGNLQRKILVDSQLRPAKFPDDSSSFVQPYNVGNCKKLRILKGCTVSRKPTCQSSNISYSRNLDC